MSKHPFAPGDVIVCVDDKPRDLGCLPVEKGTICRVREVVVWFGTFGIRTTADRLSDNVWMNADRFRHIGKADEAFTEQMKALRPTRVPA